MPLDMARHAGRAITGFGIGIQVRMVGNIGAKFFVNTLKQHHVAPIVPLHFHPSPLITGHDTFPQVKAGSRNFLADAEKLSEIIELIALEHEKPASGFKGVYGFVVGGGSKAGFDKARVGLANVKPITVMGNQDIGLIKEPVKVFDKPGVVLEVLTVVGVFSEGMSVDATLS
jgi:hypothetical protein